MVEVSPLIGRSRRISPAAFTGRALPPAQPDPVTTGLINRNSLQLGAVSNQIQSLANQMNSFTGSLQVISQNLANSQSLERQKEAQEQELERKLAEAKLREGKESQIERKIQAKTFAPLQKIADTTQFTLGRLGGFFASLLGGWLLVKGVETIKALSENNKEKLEEIRDTVIRNLSTIAGTFAIYKTVLAAMRGRFSRLGLLLGTIALTGIFMQPIRQFLGFLIDKAGEIKDKIPGNQYIPGLNQIDFDAAADAVRGENNTQEEGEEQQPPQIDPGKTASEQGLNYQGNPTEPLEIENPDAKGGPSLAMPTENIFGEKINEAATKMVNESFTKDLNLVNIDSSMFFKNQKEDTQSDQVETTTKPQETMLGKPAEEPIDPNVPAQYGEKTIEPIETPPPVVEDMGESPTIEGDSGNMFQADQMRTADTTFNLDLNLSDSISGAEKYVAKVATLPVNEMFTPIKKDVDVSQRMGPAPEPPVNVIPMPIQNQQSAPQTQPVATGAINNAPSFATSNSDNIYTLGAYSNFNVLPV